MSVLAGQRLAALLALPAYILFLPFGLIIHIGLGVFWYLKTHHRLEADLGPDPVATLMSWQRLSCTFLIAWLLIPLVVYLGWLPLDNIPGVCPAATRLAAAPLFPNIIEATEAHLAIKSGPAVACQFTISQLLLFLLPPLTLMIAPQPCVFVCLLERFQMLGDKRPRTSTRHLVAFGIMLAFYFVFFYILNSLSPKGVEDFVTGRDLRGGPSPIMSMVILPSVTSVFLAITLNALAVRLFSRRAPLSAAVEEIGRRWLVEIARMRAKSSW